MAPLSSTRQAADGLLVEAGRGSTEAFSQLYDAYGPRAMGVAMHVLRSREHAEEVVQEVFVEIWRKAPTYDPAKGSAAGWILRLANSRAIDRLRSVIAAAERDELDAMLEATTRFTVVEDDALGNVEGERLRRAVDSIGEPHRTAVMLAFFAGLSHSELAEHTGVALGTAKTRVRDGLKKLKVLVGKEALS